MPQKPLRLRRSCAPSGISRLKVPQSSAVPCVHVGGGGRGGRSGWVPRPGALAAAAGARSHRDLRRGLQRRARPAPQLLVGEDVPALQVLCRPKLDQRALGGRDEGVLHCAGVGSAVGRRWRRDGATANHCLPAHTPHPWSPTPPPLAGCRAAGCPWRRGGELQRREVMARVLLLPLGCAAAGAAAGSPCACLVRGNEVGASCTPACRVQAGDGGARPCPAPHASKSARHLFPPCFGATRVHRCIGCTQVQPPPATCRATQLAGGRAACLNPRARGAGVIASPWRVGSRGARAGEPPPRWARPCSRATSASTWPPGWGTLWTLARRS